jgi:Tfp pilus assembly ATPase PilU
MQTFDQSLAHLIQIGTVTITEAMDSSTNPHDLRVVLEQRGIIQTGGQF